MDYIILNNDGSLQKQSLTRYINQGSHGVDKIFIGWANGLATDILQVVFTLPNQTTNTVLGEFESNYNYDGEHTINGWVITLTNAQTTYNGLLLASARIIRSGIVQVAYPFTLVINETGVMPDTDSGLTIAQIDSYLLNIQNLVAGAVRQNTDAALSPTSENPVQNKVVTNAIETLKRGSYTKVDTTEYPTLADFLATTGEEGYLYLYPVNVSDEDEGYYQYIWENNLWVSLGTTEIDIANMMTTDTTQSVSGQKTFAGGVIISTSFSSQGHLPATTETYDLGSNEKKWDRVFLRTIHTASGNLTLSVGSNIEIYCNQNAYMFPNQDGYLYLGKSNKRFSCVFTGSIANDFSALQIRGKGGINFQCDNGSSIGPSTNGQLNLGSSDAAWKDLYLSDTVHISATSFYEGADGSLVFVLSADNKALRPSWGDHYNLGTSSYRWNYVYTNYISNGTTIISVNDIATKVDTADVLDLGAFDSNGEITIAISDLEDELYNKHWGTELNDMYMFTYSYAQAIIYLNKTQLETAGGYGIAIRTAMPVVYNLTGSAEPGNLIIKKVGSNYVFKVSNGVQKAAATLHLYMIKTGLIS